MKTYERQDFINEYGVTLSGISSCVPGETINLNGRKVKVKDVTKDRSGFKKTMLLSEKGKEFVLDLGPHWERGPEGDIHICREGAMNLVKAVYVQTEKDYEELYLGNMKNFEIEQLPGENRYEFENRVNYVRCKAMKDCEEFLGPVFTKFAKIKALWKTTQNVNIIAETLGENPQHISCVVDRLGLNRTETAQDEPEEE